MKTLSLLRHAKSSWDDPDLTDFDRPLARRGIGAATRMGRHMRDGGSAPDRVLCSPARRTRQTAELCLPEAGISARIHFDDALYEASAATLVLRLQRLPKSCRHALLIGHNPGLHELALSLLGSQLPDEHATLARKLPTGALVVLECAIEQWADLNPPCARLVHYAMPKQLRD